MANEITITMSMSASKGGASINTVGATGPASASYDMTGTDMIQGTQIVTTTTAPLNLGSVTAPMRVYLCNIAEPAGPSIRVGNANADPITSIISELDPGDECFLVIPSGTTIYVESTADSPTLFYACCEK